MHKLAYLVTGGCGFVGSNVVATLLHKGAEVIIVDTLVRPGTHLNLEWLRTLGTFEFFDVDTRSSHDLEPIFRQYKIDCVFHLAGQVAMTTSLLNPRRDFEVNVLGTINILELVRLHSPNATIVYASSNKVYGELKEELQEFKNRYEPIGKKSIDESAPLEFFTPYGCSKGAADQYMLEYARNFGLNTIVFRHSTIYGGRQISTFDQGWVGWFCQQALETLKNPNHIYTINGDGKQVRDLLHVSDAVRCYLSAYEHSAVARGQAFNIGGGWENSMSLLELFQYLEEKLSIKMKYQQLPWRANDQKYFVADNSKAQSLLQWSPRVSKEKGVADALAWEKSREQR